MGFEPTIYGLTGHYVKPLHHRAVLNVERSFTRHSEFKIPAYRCQGACGRPEIMTPLNSSVKMSPYGKGDINIEREGTSPGLRGRWAGLVAEDELGVNQKITLSGTEGSLNQVAILLVWPQGGGFGWIIRGRLLPQL